VSVLCGYKLCRKTINSVGFDFYVYFKYDHTDIIGDRLFNYAYFDTHIRYIMMLKDIRYSSLNHI
jgi:hypothetical protein